MNRKRFFLWKKKKSEIKSLLSPKKKRSVPWYILILYGWKCVTHDMIREKAYPCFLKSVMTLIKEYMGHVLLKCYGINQNSGGFLITKIKPLHEIFVICQWNRKRSEPYWYTNQCGSCKKKKKKNLTTSIGSNFV